MANDRLVAAALRAGRFLPLTRNDSWFTLGVSSRAPERVWREPLGAGTKETTTAMPRKTRRLGLGPSGRESDMRGLGGTGPVVPRGNNGKRPRKAGTVRPGGAGEKRGSAGECRA